MPIRWQVHARFGDRFAVFERPSWAAASNAAKILVAGTRPVEKDRFAALIERGPGAYFCDAGDDWRVLVQRLPDSDVFTPGVPLLCLDDTVQ